MFFWIHTENILPHTYTFYFFWISLLRLCTLLFSFPHLDRVPGTNLVEYKKSVSNDQVFWFSRLCFWPGAQLQKGHTLSIRREKTDTYSTWFHVVVIYVRESVPVGTDTSDRSDWIYTKVLDFQSLTKVSILAVQLVLGGPRWSESTFLQFQRGT